MSEYSFIQYRKEMNLPDGIYNGKYNSEPTIIRMKDGIPVYVTFIGFLNADGEPRSSSIYNHKGVTHSNVELLIPAQKIK